MSVESADEAGTHQVARITAMMRASEEHSVRPIISMPDSSIKIVSRLLAPHRQLIHILAEAAVEAYLNELESADEVGQRDIDGGPGE